MIQLPPENRFLTALFFSDLPQVLEPGPVGRRWLPAPLDSRHLSQLVGRAVEPRVLRFWTKEAKAGDPFYQCCLGFYYTILREESSRGFFWWRQAAERGEPYAIFQLGLHFGQGHGVERDQRRGVEFLVQAGVELGHPEAMFFLGSLYREGFWGTTRDLARGLELIRRAAQLGLPRAQHHLGRLYLIDEIDLPRDPDQAFYWLLKAVESGEELAYCHLGLCYLDGLGVPPNEALATRMLARATRAGSASAAYNLAICLLIGRGVAEDHNQSFELLKVALEGGVTIATYQIALAYRFGLGAPRDPAQARLWLTKAVEAGVIRAKLDLAEFYLQGQGGPPLLEEGLNLLRAVSSPSANGPKDIARDAQFRLGLYLSEGGWGIKKDIAEAIHWISLAAQNDHLEANLFLAVWWREGRPGWPPNLEKSQGYLRRAEALGYKSPESEEASGEDWVPSPPVKVTLH